MGAQTKVLLTRKENVDMGSPWLHTDDNTAVCLGENWPVHIW